MEAEPSSEELMARAAAGDDDAFAGLVRRHQGPVLNFCRRMGVQGDAAEDLVQDIFLNLHRCRRRWRPEARFTTFLYTMARNGIVDHFRRRARHGRMLSWMRAWAREEEAPPPEDDRAQRALGTLPEEMRAVVVLGVLQDLRYAEVARVLGIPEGTVKSRMHHAMRKLREELGHARE